MTQIAFITGAATGIGAAVARTLSGLGVKVAICDINEADGHALASELSGVFIPCDVSDLSSVEAAVAQCEAALGVPDFAHLNAGIMTVPAGDHFLPIEEVSAKQYRNIVGVNLDGIFHATKTLLPKMRTKGGAITLTASIAGLGAVPVDPMYTATKYAVIGFGRAVAAANEGSNVRINVICPAVVDTQIVPPGFKSPQFNMMPTQVMADEIVDLLQNAPNGEVRVKMSAERPAFQVVPQDLNS